jgi:hypothetical protein
VLAGKRPLEHDRQDRGPDRAAEALEHVELGSGVRELGAKPATASPAI